jgi:hypothetical protein
MAKLADQKEYIRRNNTVIQQAKKTNTKNNRPVIIGVSEIDFTPTPERTKLNSMINKLRWDEIAKLYALMIIGRGNCDDWVYLVEAGIHIKVYRGTSGCVTFIVKLKVGQ